MKFNIPILLCLFFFSSLSLHAQTWNLEENSNRDNRLINAPKRCIVDTSLMECVYEHVIYDPILDMTEIKDYILEIGKNASRYGGYGTYQRDSILMTDYPNGLKRKDVRALSQKYGASLNEIIQDRSTSKISYYERLFIDNYMYEEPIPHIDWKLIGVKEEICGYECQKATCSFRGREWTAWYCPEIKANVGPWKFGGLPGVILKVEDSKKEHIFEALQIRKSLKEFGYYRTNKSSMKTDRVTFNKMVAHFYDDAGNFLEGNPAAPKTAGGKPVLDHKRRFFNPIEKE